MDALMATITPVTSGLGVAFDTTLVALVMSIILSFPASAVQKAEEDLLNEVDEYCLDNLLKRLDDGGRSSGLPELSGDQEDLLVQISNLQREMAETHGKQVKLVQDTTEAITRQTQVLEQHLGKAAKDIEDGASHTLELSQKKIEASFATLTEGITNLNKVLKDLNGKTVEVKKKGLFG